MLAGAESCLNESFVVVSVGKVPFPLSPQWTPELSPSNCAEGSVGRNVVRRAHCPLQDFLPAGAAEGSWLWL